MSKSFFKVGIAFVTLFLCCSLVAFAQEGQSQRKSPPATVSAKVNGVSINIDYSRPSKRGRLIWGGVVKFDEVWRTGANEATVFKLSASVRINGELLKEGTYALFSIPGKEKWTIIFNDAPVQWGAYTYNSEKDVLRLDVTPSYGNPVVEQFTIDIDKQGNVTMKWDDAIVSFKIS